MLQIAGEQVWCLHTIRSRQKSNVFEKNWTFLRWEVSLDRFKVAVTWPPTPSTSLLAYRVTFLTALLFTKPMVCGNALPHTPTYTHAHTLFYLPTARLLHVPFLPMGMSFPFTFNRTMPFFFFPNSASQLLSCVVYGTQHRVDVQKCHAD